MGGGRAPCCDKNNVKRGPWSPAEDLRLAAFIQKHGHGNWRSLPKQAGLLRCGKSCRLRWINYLSPNVKRGNFTLQEEETIIKLHHSYGNKWSKIAAELPGRTDNEIKNVWNTHLKKRLLPGKADYKHQKINEIKSNTCSPKSSNSPASSTTTTDTWCKNRGTVELTTSDHDHDHDQDPVAKMAEDIVLPENCQKKETSRSSSFSSNASNFSSLNTPLQMDQNVAKPSQETESLFSYSLDSNLQELLNELDDVMDSEFDVWNVLENVKDPQDQSSHENNNNRINSDDIELSEWYRYLKNNEVGLEGIIGEEEKKGDQNVDFSKEVLSLEPEEIADSFPLWPASPHNF